MFLHVASLLAGLGLALAAQCPHNNCYRQIIASAFPDRDGVGDCNTFLMQTTTAPTPLATVTITKPPVTRTKSETFIYWYSSISTNLYVYTYTSVTITTPIVTESGTWTSWADYTTETDYIATTFVTLTLPREPSSFGQKRAVSSTAASAIAVPTSHTIPAYASGCANSAQYSRFCQCAGATIATFTVTPPPHPSKTLTLTTTPTVTVTDYISVGSTQVVASYVVSATTEWWIQPSYVPTTTTTEWLSTVGGTITTTINGTATETVTVTVD